MNITHKNNLIWIDLEMTGLNPEKHYIIEIATLVTNSDLEIIAEGPSIPIFQSNKILNTMNKWNLKTHTQNGLIEKIKKSIYNESIAEKITLEFLKKWVPKNKSPMCGNTISQDRRFLFKYMPNLESFFHYRHIDVSTLKELAIRWNPDILQKNKIKKKQCHIASEDIHASILELSHYKKYFIKN